MSDIEPFFDRVCDAQNVLEPTKYRFGYRTKATKSVVTQIEMPAEIIDSIVVRELSLVPRITPDGKVTADLTHRNGFTIETDLKVIPIPIHELVGQGVSLENLRLEEARTDELRALLCELERSVSAVRAALAQFAETGRTGTDRE